MTLDAESSGKTLSLVTEQGRFFHRDLGHAIEILDHTHTCCFHRLDVPQHACEIAIGFCFHRRHAVVRSQPKRRQMSFHSYSRARIQTR